MSKRYNRLRNISLPKFPIRKANLIELLINRSSYREFSGKPISLQQLSEILHYSAGLVRESEGKFQTYVKKHNLTMEQRLQAETSPAGRELAELALSHCDAKIGLITQGGWDRGLLI